MNVKKTTQDTQDTSDSSQNGILSDTLDKNDPDVHLGYDMWNVVWDLLSGAMKDISWDHGFRGIPFPTHIALMHSELSEALEADRHSNPPSEKIPEFSSIEEEFADTVIRIMQVSAEYGYRTGAAIIAKAAYNETRPYKHGNKKY